MPNLEISLRKCNTMIKKLSKAIITLFLSNEGLAVEVEFEFDFSFICLDLFTISGIRHLITHKTELKDIYK